MTQTNIWIIPKKSLSQMGQCAVVHVPYVTCRVNIRRCKPYHQKVMEIESATDSDDEIK